MTLNASIQNLKDRAVFQNTARFFFVLLLIATSFVAVASDVVLTEKDFLEQRNGLMRDILRAPAESGLELGFKLKLLILCQQYSTRYPSLAYQLTQSLTVAAFREKVLKDIDRSVELLRSWDSVKIQVSRPPQTLHDARMTKFDRNRKTNLLNAANARIEEFSKGFEQALASYFEAPEVGGAPDDLVLFLNETRYHVKRYHFCAVPLSADSAAPQNPIALGPNKR